MFSNPNMTYEELREHIENSMEGYRYYIHGSTDKSDPVHRVKFKDSPSVDYLIQLFATFMDNLLTNAVNDKNFTKEVDAYIKKVRAELGPLTTKNTGEENV